MALRVGVGAGIGGGAIARAGDGAGGGGSSGGWGEMAGQVGEGFDGIEILGRERPGGALDDDDGLGETDLAAEMVRQGGKGAHGGCVGGQQIDGLAGLARGGRGQHDEDADEKSPEQENGPAKVIGKTADGRTRNKNERAILQARGDGGNQGEMTVPARRPAPVIGMNL